MKHFIPVVLSIILLLPSIATGLEISSVYPESATIGSTVTIIGGPFSSSVRVVLGGQEIDPSLVNDRQLAFVVPPLEIGDQSLYLFDDEGKSEQTISLRISLPVPQITSLEPSNVDECSTEEERTVTVTGDFFQEGAQIMMGGQIVQASRESDSEMGFVLPPLNAGTYGIQVFNPDGGESTAHSLWLNNIPHIYDVNIGADFVSSYQLIINGKNFNHNSSLIVYEYPVGLTDLPPQQHVIPSQGGASFRGEQALSGLSESLVYIDCKTLIYNRFPYSGQDKTLILRVGNPDGKQTEPFELSAP